MHQISYIAYYRVLLPGAFSFPACLDMLQDFDSIDMNNNSN